MTNREVYKEVETAIAPYYPNYSDTNSLRLDINRIVGIVQFELNIPQMMAVNYVRNVISAYKPKVEDDKND